MELSELDRLQEQELVNRIERISEMLSSRKRLNGMQYYIPNKNQFKAHNSSARTILFVGGNRCLGGETKLYDPHDDKFLRLEQIDEPFHVRAWNGEELVSAKAHTPFVKGWGPLFRITLSNGGRLIANALHKILTPSGFLSVSELRVGSVVSTPTCSEFEFHKISTAVKHSQNLCEFSSQSSQLSSRNQDRKTLSHSRRMFSTSYSQKNAIYHDLPVSGVSHLQTIAEHDLLVHEQDDVHLMRKAQDFQDGYPVYYGLCDERFRLKEVSGQAFFPLQDGVPEHTYGIQHEPEHSQICLLPDHLSTEDGSFHNYNVSPDCLKPSCETSFVTGIEFERYDVFYDFTVPNYHNYQDVSSIISANSGKSTFGAMELAYHLTRKYPDYFSPTRRFKKPIKAVISCTSFPILNRVIEPKLKDLLPQDYYTVKRTPQGHLSQIFCKDGSCVDILTGEMDDMAYEGADWDFAWCDEPQQQRKYQAILRGLVDRRGITVITFTPLTEPWMKELLVDRADSKSIALFQADIRDNKETIDGTPILSEEGIAEFELELPDDVKQTRLHGHFFHLRGLVYQEFSEAHIKDFSYSYPDPVICVLDPHDRNPHHLLWAYIDREDDVFVDYELVTRCELPELAQKILEIEKARGYKMKARLIDPNFGRKPASVGTNRNVIQELGYNSVYFTEANDNIELGHMLVRDALHYDRSKPITAINKPKLFFSRDRVPFSIRSVRNHQFAEWVGKTKDDRDPKEVQKDKETHGADCVRYLMISRPTWRSFFGKVKDQELSGVPY